MLSSLNPSAITWGGTTVLGDIKEQVAPDRSSYSDDESNVDDLRMTVCHGISVAMTNQDRFDDEGCMSTPLLDLSHGQLYASYRRSYAELLYAWGHPLARLEVLKFNGLKDYFIEVDIPDNKSFAASILSTDTHNTTHDQAPPSPIILGKKLSDTPEPGAGQGLDVTGYCLKHESRLEPLLSNLGGGAVGRCERCKTIQRQLRCTVCCEPISALFSPCLSCGCATHEDCLAEYHADGNTDCPGGCDCDCGVKASQGVVESWEVMMGAIERMRILESKSSPSSRAGKEKEKQAMGFEEWHGEEKTEWEIAGFPPVSVGGLGRASSTLRRIGQVRGGEWGLGSGGKKKASSLRNERLS
jgi:hypothetical protein